MKRIIICMFILMIFMIGCTEKLQPCKTEVFMKCYKYEKCREEQCSVKVDCSTKYDYYVNVTKESDDCEPLSLKVEK